MAGKKSKTVKIKHLVKRMKTLQCKLVTDSEHILMERDEIHYKVGK